MLFMVANIESDGLLGTEALQSYFPGSAYGTIVGLMGGLHCSYTNSGWHQSWMAGLDDFGGDSTGQ